MKLSKLRAANSTREIAGTKVPRMNTTSSGLRSAMKKGGHAYAWESGEVDGEHAKHRLDRPGRKHGGKVHHMEHHKHGGHVHEEHKKHGGMACKKDGGGIRDGDGESEKAADLKKDQKMEAYAERKHGGKVKEHHAHGGKVHHEKHEHEEHHAKGGHVKKKVKREHKLGGGLAGGSPTYSDDVYDKRMNDAANADDVASAREAARAALMSGVSSGAMSDARQHLLRDALSRKHGGPITTKQRNALPKSEFAEPGERKYPVDTPNRARNALSRVSQFGSESEKARVRAKVHKTYPSIGKDD